MLPDLDLTVPAGQTLALVGTTGAGKTTLAKLATRFYDPTAGRVLLDGADLRDLRTADLRDAVVMVTQENYLFSGTIADNIRFGRPDASMDDVVAATTALGAHDFISAMPDGYDTDVANSGGRLSAGQRQLVAFARAFLADPAVLILDEATSSLDVPSERLVQQALRTVLAGRTAVIIAHRLSTVEIADRVLVMEHGRIVEDGAPADLVAGGGGRYSDLHEAWLESLAYFQALSPAFHDGYTSGRVISRQTSDVDAIYEMLETGFDGLVWAACACVCAADLCSSSTWSRSAWWPATCGASLACSRCG